MLLHNDGQVSRLLKDVPIPNMFRTRQTFNAAHIERADIPDAINAAIRAAGVAERVKPGMTIAITAGSRGIRNVDVITRAVVDFVRARRSAVHSARDGQPRRRDR